ncbi:hypothetical protein ACO0K9_05855 [Undibacterium sp. Ji50W]|uniref:hypothetical protein n=1 Tax=Undibacterium sp. Ji50W TaxID=3413041 RepID=UPI003BEF9F01
MSLRHQRGISLIAVAIGSMLVALLSMGLLYYMRNGHLPMPEMWARWGKSANVITNELKNATDVQLPGNSSNSNSAPGLRQAATVEEGVRRCTINGKTVYSDTLCTDTNPTTRQVKLHDARGMEAAKSTASQASASEPGEEELKKKIMEQALGNGKK